MHILGVDPGTQACGYAVITDAPELGILTMGVIRPRGHSIQENLVAVTAAINGLADTYDLVALGIERYVPYAQRGNAHTTERLLYLIGALLVTAAQWPRVPAISLWHAGQWRRTIGAGADKAAGKLHLEALFKRRFTTRGLHDMDACGIALATLMAVQDMEKLEELIG